MGVIILSGHLSIINLLKVPIKQDFTVLLGGFMLLQK